MSDWFEKLNAYVDGELSADEAAAFEAELSQNPSLMVECDSVRKLKKTLSTKLPLHDSSSLFHTCCQRLAEIERTSANTPEVVVRKFRFALAGVVAAAIFCAGIVNRLGPAYESGVDSLSRTLTASASSSFGLGLRPGGEVATTQWVSEQLGGQVPEIGLTAHRLQLVRAEIVDCPGERSARFLYTDGRALYQLAVFSTSCPQIQDLIGENGWVRGTIGQQNFVSRVVNDFLFVLVAPRPIFELEALLR